MGDTKASISIHAARVGCDNGNGRQNTSCHYFNPRSPSGLRHGSEKTVTALDLFQSTQPEWAATKCMRFFVAHLETFQSTQPEWAATLYEIVYINNINISIHAARVGCDYCAFH